MGAEPVVRSSSKTSNNIAITTTIDRRGESNPAAEACVLMPEGLLVRRMSQCPQSISCEIGSSIVPG